MRIKFYRWSDGCVTHWVWFDYSRCISRCGYYNIEMNEYRPASVARVTCIVCISLRGKI